MMNHHTIIAILLFVTPSCHSFYTRVNPRHHSSKLYEANQPQENLLQNMVRFYGQDMIDTGTNRFYYHCRPQDGLCEHVHMPLRDMAAAWDATKIIGYLDEIGDRFAIRQSLIDAVECTLDVYLNSLDRHHPDGLIVSKDVLLERVNIGHSALLSLAACNALKLNIIADHRMNEIKASIDGLSQGILSMQLDNGAFSTYFGDDDYHNGIAFFPGEAMLALVTAYKYNILDERTNEAVIPAMLKALDFYSDHHNTGDVDINYNIWQVIAFSSLYDCLRDGYEKQKAVAQYVLTMCQEICQSKSWKYQLSRGQSFYVNLETVEIACGLDALAEGVRLATLENEIEPASLFERNAKNAVQFLCWMQSHVPDSCVVGEGGLGYGGVCVLEQRLDVTGHAISAMLKLRAL